MHVKGRLPAVMALPSIAVALVLSACGDSVTVRSGGGSDSCSESDWVSAIDVLGDAAATRIGEGLQAAARQDPDGLAGMDWDPCQGHYVIYSVGTSARGDAVAQELNQAGAQIEVRVVEHSWRELNEKIEELTKPGAPDLREWANEHGTTLEMIAVDTESNAVVLQVGRMTEGIVTAATKDFGEIVEVEPWG